ncbi:hypothetical protein I2492_06120 [Budviciaceae bacterium CWB-B4]|uniref:Uncharacterized protein n=1 Tax=Limnobaculum xujianqingii TaxID=2738837 RepID=A0A9D7FSE3_9GAMM|nr:hypothetical protein [Limnobaculum xujianqingii]MBK5072585.1 hypothetical protein [Limnobaculum xujianqingii]MBK5175894.1 hypothetical protein [Limnobaculum xujianqingii]
MYTMPIYNFVGMDSTANGSGAVTLDNNGLLYVAKTAVEGSAYYSINFDAYAGDIITVSVDGMMTSFTSGDGLKLSIDHPINTLKTFNAFTFGESLTRRTASYTVPIDSVGMQPIKVTFGLFGNSVCSGVLTNPSITIQGQSRELLMGAITQEGPNCSVLGYYAHYGIDRVAMHGTDAIRIYPIPGMAYASPNKIPIPTVTQSQAGTVVAPVEIALVDGPYNSDGSFSVRFRLATTGAMVNLIESPNRRVIFVSLRI